MRSLNQQTALVDVQSQYNTLQFSTAKGIRRGLALKVLWSVLLRFERHKFKQIFNNFKLLVLSGCI